jgi:hypothetical protein
MKRVSDHYRATGLRLVAIDLPQAHFQRLLPSGRSVFRWTKIRA